MLSRKQRLKIGIDFDSTIACIDRPWLDRLNAARGTLYRPEDWSDWDLSFLQPDERRLFFDLFTPDLYDVVTPYPGAPDAIRTLQAIPEIELVCVTSNPEKEAQAFLQAKKKWLQKYIPELSESIISAKTKTNLGLHILIDDAPHHHKDADCLCVLVRRPWNRHVTCRFEFADWVDAHDVVKKIVHESYATGYERTTLS